MGAQSLEELRTALSVAVRQGVALAAFGLTAGCAAKSERLDGDHGNGSGASGNGAASGANASGGTTSAGGSVGVEGGSSGTAGTDSIGGTTSVGGSRPMGGTTSVGGSSTSGGRGALAGAAGSGGSTELLPYPVEELGCFGPTYDGGYLGQCCVTARCYTPDAGPCVGPPAALPPIPLPSGSGTCLCSPDNPAEARLAGPYAPNPAGMASPEGTCCYLVGQIGCEGRPLLVEGAAVVAPLERRGDWCAKLG